MEVIRVENLVKKYKETTAVNNISFSVNKGELFAFLGENGAGKSTTINILCTILEKTEGTVSICGHTLQKEDDAIRKAIGIVFQNSVMDGKLTVKENIYTRGSYYGLSKAEIDKRIENISEHFEMKEIWNRKYEKLSGGQRRRVDIVRALINEPQILFLDEPTTGLDPKSRKLVWDYIDYLRKNKGMTIFLTTHYMEETRDADNVVILDKGQIIATGTPSELKSKYALSRLVIYADECDEVNSLLEKEMKNDNVDYKIESYSYDADHYNVFFDGLITDCLAKNKALFTDYEVIKGSMDDVFLKLTGREMMS